MDVNIRSCDGICFNADLVNESQRYCQLQRFRNVGEALNDMGGLAYSTILQVTFGHELAHKIRIDKVWERKLDDTPGGEPLDREAGFGVQRRIQQYFGREDERVVEVLGEGAARSYAAPIEQRLVWGKLGLIRGALTSIVAVPANEDTPPTLITQDELIEHLKYGGIDNPTDPVPQVPRGTAAAGYKRARDGEESEDRGRNQQPRLNSPDARTRGTKSPVALRPTRSEASVKKSPVAPAPIAAKGVPEAPVKSTASLVEPDSRIEDEEERL